MHGPRQARRGSSLNDPGLILDGSVLIRDGLIQDVGPTRRVENLIMARDAIEINVPGRVVMPGFVDCHTHLAFPPPGWAPTDSGSAMNAVRTATAKTLAIQMRRYLAAMARHGTTTVEAKAGCGGGKSAEMKLLRGLSLAKSGPIDVVPTFLLRLPAEGASPDPAEIAIDWACEFLPLACRRHLVQFADIEWSADENRVRLIRRYLEKASQLGLGSRIHADGDGSATAALVVAELRLSGLDHLERIFTADSVKLVASGPMITLLPAWAFQTGSAQAPARALVDAGAAVALGSNFNRAESPMLNMQATVSLACREMGLTPAEALVAATVNGAHALGRASNAGSIELGMPADLIVLNTSDYRDLSYHSGTNLVHLTMKRGEFIYQEGDVAPLPAEQLRLGW